MSIISLWDKVTFFLFDFDYLHLCRRVCGRTAGVHRRRWSCSRRSSGWRLSSSRRWCSSRSCGLNTIWFVFLLNYCHRWSRLYKKKYYDYRNCCAVEVKSSYDLHFQLKHFQWMHILDFTCRILLTCRLFLFTAIAFLCRLFTRSFWWQTFTTRSGETPRFRARSWTPGATSWPWTWSRPWPFSPPLKQQM